MQLQHDRQSSFESREQRGNILCVFLQLRCVLCSRAMVCVCVYGVLQASRVGVFVYEYSPDRPEEVKFQPQLVVCFVFRFVFASARHLHVLTIPRRLSYSYF